MNKAYNRINNGKGWKNYPNDETPLNEQNLNKQDIALDEIDNRVITLDNTKATKVEVSTLFKEVGYDEHTGIITFTRKNGATVTIDTPMEKIALNIYYDPVTEMLTLPLIDGTQMQVDLSRLITEYEFVDSDTISFFVGGDGRVTANIKEGSIQEEHLRPDYLSDIKIEAEKAESSAIASSQKATESLNNSLLSKSWAVGGTGVREGEDTNNSKYYSEQSKKYAESLSQAGTVSGVKGNAESAYRTGMVNLTAEQIGAVPKYSQTIDLSEAIYDQSKWYPVTGSELPITKLSLIDVEVALNSDTKPSWSTHKEGFSCSLTVLTKGHGYGKTNGETIVLNHGYRWTDNVNPCGFSQLTYSSMPVLWLRGGGKYFVNTSYNCAWTPRTSTFNPNNYGQTVAPTTAFPGVAFPVKDTIYANLNGTASAAAKLSTARKIGNASFDGSKDISVIGMGASPLVSTYISPVSAGWYRFAKFQAGNATGAQGAVDISCVINLKRTFANGSNETHKIQFLGIFQNAKFVPIASRTNTHTITKIRYVTEGSTAYLDFYYARSVQNDIRISIEDPIASDGRIWSALPLTLVPETAAGITVHASMDIPNTTANMVTLFNGRYELDTDSVCDIALGSFPYDIYAVTTTYGVFLIDGSTSGFRKAMHIRNLTSSVVIGSMSIQIQKNGTNYNAHFYSLKENAITGSSVTSNAASLDITNIVGYQFN